HKTNGLRVVNRPGTSILIQINIWHAIMRCRLSVRCWTHQEEAKHFCSLLSIQSGPFREVARLIFASFSKQRPHTLRAKSVKLIDRAQHGEAPFGIRFPAEPDGF